MKRILFLFLDGVGLGPEDPANPFAQHSGKGLRRLAGDQRWVRPLEKRATPSHLVRPIDATLGHEGLPQSGTGQASLMTGENCARLVGRHFGPYPHSKTYDVLDQANLFHRIQSLSAAPSPPCAFANAFPPRYFTATRRRATVTTRCCKAAGVRIRNISDLRQGRALPADLTGTTWREALDLEIPERSPKQAGGILTALHREHHFTLLEYFYTDKVGHKRINTLPQVLLKTLDQFLKGLLTDLDPAHESLLVTSDHGNLEDTSHTQHTRNPVPLIVYGWAAPHFAEATDLTDVTPGIVRALRAAPDA